MVPLTRHRRRALIAGAAATVVAVAGIISWQAFAAQGPEPGPLREAPEHVSAIPVPAGSTFTDGLEVLKFPGATGTPQLTSVKLVGAKGMKLVGVLVAGPGRSSTVNYVDHWPPTGDGGIGDIRPFHTPLVANSAGWELLLGIKATGTGYLTRDGLQINYEVNGTEYSRFLPAKLALCTSRKALASDSCPFPPGTT